MNRKDFGCKNITDYDIKPYHLVSLAVTRGDHENFNKLV